ncbi:MAG: protein-L-IsoD(D-D) O-methyltransferase, partial [Selenomonadaceae bacterium]|nr:protein-L-IsoD(D-D) O-methyltransferase [Selenomonadaceae bacterium]
MNNFIVTTIRKPTEAVEMLAKEIALKLGGQFVKREDLSFDALTPIHGVENVLLVKKNSLSVITSAGELFFHP